MKRFAKRCSSSYKTLLQCTKFLLINPWDYEIFGAGGDFPSPAPIYLRLIYQPFLLYLIFHIILIQSLQTFRNRRNASPFCCK
ncbi:TPA: hypothetical protein HMQ09_03865 [Escherichia coli]|nr:hypothetical protein [Escherichia coli]HAJ2450534.1 hypothetical protein [Escherichia coli]